MPSLRSRVAHRALLPLLALSLAGLLACGEEEPPAGSDWPPPPGMGGAAPQTGPGSPQPGAQGYARPGPAPGPPGVPAAVPPPVPTPGPAPVAPDPFSGSFGVSYEGSVYTLELQTRDGQRYQGFVTLAGRRYPIQGARQGGQLVGRFNDPDGSVYGYVGRPDGANLVFVLDDGETIPFQRVARAPTPARQALPPGRSAAPPPPGSAAPAPPANWPPPPPPPR